MVDKLLYLARHAHRLPRFLAQYLKFKAKVEGWRCSLKDVLPILNETSPMMQFDAHYVYHTGWAARLLKELSPTEHVDISSSLMFCAIASAHTTIRHYDYRRPILSLPGIECGSADLLALPFADDSIPSLSCMHVIEHVGLGRYGDPINAAGDVAAVQELKRVLAPGGNLLIVVPMAERALVRFNGHRIYDVAQVERLFEGLKLVEFSFLNEARDNRFIRHASEPDIAGSHYGCGCFLYRKPATR